MDFKLAQALDVIPPGFKTSLTPVYFDSEDLWTAGSINICKSGKNDYQESKSIKEFEKLLPQLKHVKELFVGYRTSASLFNAICQMDWLERLEIYQPCQKSLQSITNLQHLTHLQLGCCPQLDTLESLSQLKRLKALGMDGSFKHVTQLDPIGDLVQLRGLMLVGGDYYTQYYDSLDPLASLVDLQYLGLAAIKTGDRSLDALCHMKQLRCIHIIKLSGWPKADYEKVYRHLPDLKDEEFRLAATDREFQKKNRIR